MKILSLYKQLFLTALLSLTGTTIYAYEYDIAVKNDFGVTIYYNIINDGNELEVVRGDNLYRDVVNIPNIVTYMNRTRKVTSIGVDAFKGDKGLKSVTIPNSVTCIGREAFSKCGITSIKIPNSVTTIGGGAFACTGLTSLTIPNSVTSIECNPIAGCEKLISITVDLGNLYYDSRDKCNAIIETKTNTLVSGCIKTVIPNSVISIGLIAFHSCKGLTSVTIPNSVTSIGEAAFQRCYDLTSVTIGNSVTSIETYAFYECDGLTSVVIPNSVTTIGKRAFHHCSGLTSVTIGNSVTTIGEEAFSYCQALKSVTILNSVTNIGKKAFEGCSPQLRIIRQ